MNLFPAPTERDQAFKTYLSQYKATAKAIDTAATTRTFNEQMRQIIEKFPYFDHTTARIMAVAMYMVATASTSNPTFDREKAASLIDTAFANFRTKKDQSTRAALIIDVARYFTRIISSS